MRADAARNLDAVLLTAARLLAEDPSASIASIAATAGVDRRTIYRRFPNRDALLCGVMQAKLDAIDDVVTQSRLTEARTDVALHRFVEGTIDVIRRFPVRYEQMDASPSTRARYLAQREKIDAFLRRAADDGLIRADLPEAMVWPLLFRVVDGIARQYPELEVGRAADLAVDVLLKGLGRES